MRILLGLVFFSTFFLTACKKNCPTCEECPAPECTDQDLAKGLMAYYPFNGNSNDESGNGNNATPNNGAHLAADMIGRPNKAAEFDGIDDYFLVPDNGKLNSKSVTISFNVMVTDINRIHAMVNRVKFSNATAVTWGVGQSLASTNVFDFSVNDPAESCGQVHAYNPSRILSSPEQMIAGKWYSVICTYGDGKQVLYIDGVKRGEKETTFKELKQCVESNLVIGGWWSGGISSITGKIDEVRIYNRVVSQCEIDKLSASVK